SKIFFQPPNRRSDVLITSPQRQTGMSVSSRGNCENSVRSSWRRGKCVSKSSVVSIPSRRSASNRGRGIQLKSSRFVETLVMPFELGASSLLGCAQALDPHANQSLVAIFIHSNPECDVPWRRRKFICRAVEIDGTTNPVAL